MDSYVRVEAVKRITNQVILVDFALNDKNSKVRIEAILNNNLIDQIVLTDITKNNKYGVERIIALYKLNNKSIAQEVFIDFIKQDKEINVNALEFVVEMLTDQTIENITDTTFLEIIMRLSKSDSRRLLAFEKLKSIINNQNNLNIITEIINSEGEKYIYTKYGYKFIEGAGNPDKPDLHGYSDMVHYIEEKIDLRETARKRLSELKNKSFK